MPSKHPILVIFQKFNQWFHNQQQQLYSRLAALPLWASLTIVTVVALLYVVVVTPVLGLIIFSVWSNTIYSTYSLVVINGFTDVLGMIGLLILKDFDAIVGQSVDAQLSFFKHVELMLQYFFIFSPGSAVLYATVALMLVVGFQYFWNWYYALVKKQKNLCLYMPLHRTALGFGMCFVILLIATFAQGRSPILALGFIVGLMFVLVLINKRKSIKEFFKPNQNFLLTLSELGRIALWTLVILLVLGYVFPNFYGYLCELYTIIASNVSFVFVEITSFMRWLKSPVSSTLHNMWP